MSDTSGRPATIEAAHRRAVYVIERADQLAALAERIDCNAGRWAKHCHEHLRTELLRPGPDRALLNQMIVATAGRVKIGPVTRSSYHQAAEEFARCVLLAYEG